MHEGVKAAQTGERGVERGLVAGGEGMGRTGGERFEVAAECGDTFCCTDVRSELNDWERVGCELREVAVVYAGDDVAGEIARMQPSGKSEDAAFRATKLLDLGDENGTGAGDGLGLGHRSAQGEGVERREEFWEGDGGGFSA